MMTAATADEKWTQIDTRWMFEQSLCSNLVRFYIVKNMDA